MINVTEKQVSLEFGTGDICVNGGYYIHDGNKVGMVGFTNQSPRQIGEVGIIEIGSDYRVGDFPVTMEFHRKESIDVVIRALEEAKSHMK